MKKIDFKQIWSTLLIILVFAVTSIIYFYPAMESKAVYAGDCINGSAAVIPAGTHTLAMIFDPESVQKGNTLSLICFGIFCATLVAAIAMEIIKRRKAKTAICEK